MASYGGVVHVVCLLPLSNNLLWTHTHSHLTALFPGLPRWASTRKVKPIWILLKQETVSGSGISWAICKSAPCSRQTTHTSTPSLCFLQAGCPSCRPTKSVKALKALLWTHDQEMSMIAMPQCYTKLSEGLLWLGSYFLCLVKESTAHVLVSFFSFLLQTGLHVSVRDEFHWLCIVQLNVFCWIM